MLLGFVGYNLENDKSCFSVALDAFSTYNCCFATKLYQKNGDVLLTCQAYNGRVVMQWLAETVSEVAQHAGADVDDRVKPIALCVPLA